MIIFLDFDGTVVEHDYPRIGRENPGAFQVIEKLQNAGHDIILNTYRKDAQDNTFEEAVEYLNFHPYYDRIHIDRSCNKLLPKRWNWDEMKKENVIFIDDLTPDIPLKQGVQKNRDMVDWRELDKEFIEQGIYL